MSDTFTKLGGKVNISIKKNGASIWLFNCDGPLKPREAAAYEPQGSGSR